MITYKIRVRANHKQIGAALRHWRCLAGYTLAQASDLTRLSEEKIARLEEGRDRATLGNLRLLSASYGVLVWDIFERAVFYE